MSTPRNTVITAVSRKTERALSSFDQRHKFVFYGSFETPYEASEGSWRGMLSDLTLTPIVRANSGRPSSQLSKSSASWPRFS